MQKVRMSDTALVIIAVMMSHLKIKNKHQMIEGGLSRAVLYSANQSCCSSTSNKTASLLMHSSHSFSHLGTRYLLVSLVLSS